MSSTPSTTQSPPAGMRTEASLIVYNGSMLVEGTINGTTTVMLQLDSGASQVILPKSVGIKLANNGTLARDDYVGEETFVLANGRRVQLSTYRLRSITVGGRTATDVKYAISNSEASSILLGQSFLKKFASWSINNARNTLVHRMI